MYFVDDVDDKQGRKSNHLTVIAQNAQGWKNLCKLSTASFVKGFYYLPRIDWAMLEKYREGLIVLSGCMQGRIQASLLNDDADDARAHYDRMVEIFGDQFFIEFMPLVFPER